MFVDKIAQFETKLKKAGLSADKKRALESQHKVMTLLCLYLDNSFPKSRFTVNNKLRVFVGNHKTIANRFLSRDEKRHNYMSGFLNQFYAEWEGEK